MAKSSLYTRTGDKGTTSLVGGTRVSKTSPRLEAYGAVDELNSHIGLLLAMEGIPAEVAQVLGDVQHRLFNLGAQLATEPDCKWQPQGITDADVAALEAAIDDLDEKLPKHKQFLLPGGHIASAQANVARTVARRAERRIIQMAEQGIHVDDTALRYVNRLSDYLFAASRTINIANGVAEVAWKK